MHFTELHSNRLSGEGAAPALLECYLKITAWTGVYDARSRALLGRLALLVGVSRFQLMLIEAQLAAAVLEIAEQTPEEVSNVSSPTYELKSALTD
jgi:hypothetical protein